MHSHSRERGAALILLIGITATLAILAASLVSVLGNQQHATAMERVRRTSQQYAEGALDIAVTTAKTATISTMDSNWLTPEELLAAFASGFDGGVLPEGMSATFRIYDNSGDGTIGYDANGDGMMWLEATITYRGKTTRMRCLIRQSEQSVITAFPKAVVYSDSGISLEGTSDVYAVKSDGFTPWAPAPPYATTIMAGGGWTNGMPGSAKDFTANSSANLAAPTSSVQSVNIQVNGSVSPANKFGGTIIGGVGLLSDYFDQAAQADLMDEAQAGSGHAGAPGAPSPWTNAGYTTMSNTVRTLLQSTTSTATYDAPDDLYRSGNLTLSRGTSTIGRIFNFRNLYVSGNLTLTGPVTVNCASLYVGGTLTINNATTTTVTDSFGPLYVNGTGATSVTGRVNITTTSTRTGGALTITNATTTPLTDQFGALYVVGALGVSGPVTLANTSSVYSGGAATITGPTSGSVTDQLGVLYCGSTLSLANNVQMWSKGLVVNGNFTISGANTPLVDQFGPMWVSGIATWGGSASVRSTDYTNPAVKPAPMWIGILESQRHV